MIEAKKVRRSAAHGLLFCEACGTSVQKRSPSQRYCKPCSEKRDLTRKKLHQESRGKRIYEQNRDLYVERGRFLSSQTKTSPESALPEVESAIWTRRFAIPFSWAGSKNHLFSSTRTGHTFMRDESRYYRSLLTGAIADSDVPALVVPNKLWLGVFVEKPNHKGDAANFCDMICDAVKDAIGLDDRWFSIRTIDWQIVKHDPQIYVSISQDSNLAVQACSSCGQLHEYNKFGKNRAARNGIGRVCADCRIGPDAPKRQRRRQSVSIFD